MTQPLPPAIFLMGPTASGKTGAAVELVQQLPLELISVESALVFRGMDNGTAKPDAATLAQAPHFLIDIIDPAVLPRAAARPVGLAAGQPGAARRAGCAGSRHRLAGAARRVGAA